MRRHAAASVAGRVAPFTAALVIGRPLLLSRLAGVRVERVFVAEFLQLYCIIPQPRLRITPRNNYTGPTKRVEYSQKKKQKPVTNGELP